MSASPTEEPELHVPGFTIRDTIARGGMGQVVRAFDTVFGREVALKLMLPRFRGHPEAEARFAAEARITGRLQHPGIPPVHHFGRLPDGSLFLAMKLIQGRTLAELLARDALPFPERTAVFEQICRAVGSSHRRGIIHRDLKPSNVMVGEFGEVQVMDWGLAKELQTPECELRADECGPTPGVDAPDSDTALYAQPSDAICAPLSDPQFAATHGAHATRPGDVLGTIPYMPPEQARGQIALLDARADVFALGAILCEMLTGSPPYAGTRLAGLRAMAEAGDTADALHRLEACGANAELIAIAKRCLETDREARPADAGAVAQLVADYRAGVEQRAREAEADAAAATARLLGERKRRRLRQLSGVLGGLLTAGSLGFAWWSDEQDHRNRLAQERHDAEQRRAEREVQARERELAAKRQEAQLLDTQHQQKAQRVREAVIAGCRTAQELRRQARYKEAMDALFAAARLLDGSELDDLYPVLDEVAADIDFASELDNIRYKQWSSRTAARTGTSRAASPAANSQAPQRYRSAFLKRGWNFDEGDPAVLASRIRKSSLRVELTEALEDWAQAEPDPVRRGRLLAVLKEAESGR